PMLLDDEVRGVHHFAEIVLAGVQEAEVFPLARLVPLLPGAAERLGKLDPELALHDVEVRAAGEKLLRFFAGRLFLLLPELLGLLGALLARLDLLEMVDALGVPAVRRVPQKLDRPLRARDLL